ncbi:MAG: transcriptional regulator [candidate division Zixibacteria bacterium RBG_16_53_22]|nr:MAG: transcriptional regulator [candidate division Zixibacteria bacterium RBG_16_53_22]
MKVINERDRVSAQLKADVLKALGHPTRLMMVEALAGGERCVCELNELVEADHSTISKHLAILKQAGVVSDRKEGLKVFYRLEVPCIMRFLGCVTSVVESRSTRHLAAVKGRG